MKVAENSPQNARNCIIFKNFLGDMPPNSLAIKGSQLCCSRHAALRHVQNLRNFKVAPPENPAYAPAYIYSI